MPIHSVDINVRLLEKSQSGLSRAPHILWVGALLIAMATSITSGCGTHGQATMSLVAPSAATKGTAFTVTVNVVYQGKPDSIINGVIHFTSSDPAAVLPIDYQFTRADAGSHTWTNGFILSTPGNQTITGQIHDASAINASATIAVSP
jgi:hypothetical protein